MQSNNINAIYHKVSKQKTFRCMSSLGAIQSCGPTVLESMQGKIRQYKNMANQHRPLWLLIKFKLVSTRLHCV
jgi:hypothetical protein